MSRLSRLSRAWQRGQSALEYLVGATLLTFLVAIPYKERTAVEWILWAIRTAFAKFLGALSLPV